MATETFGQKDSLFRQLGSIPKRCRDQEKEDMMQDNLSNKEYKDPFKG